MKLSTQSLTRLSLAVGLVLLQVSLSLQAPAGQQCTLDLDVAIVGAGPGGTYAAYKLKDKNLNMGVFEYSNRVGGRLYTAHLPNVPDMNLELGGMRYVVDHHVLVEELVEELNLEYHRFPSGLVAGHPSRMFRRNTSMLKKDFWGSGKVPYNLTQEERDNQDDLMGYYIRKLVNESLEGIVPIEKLFQLTVPDGRKLYELSAPEAIRLVASPDGQRYLLDEDHMNDERISAIDMVEYMFSVNGLPYGPEHILTLKNGMSSYPQALLDSFLGASSNHSVYMNHRLASITDRQSGGYQLVFRKTATVNDVTSDSPNASDDVVVCAKRVILAVPKFALQRIDWMPLRSDEYKRVLNSTVLVHASKVFMTFPTSWWLNNSTYPASSVNAEYLGEIYNWGVSNVSGDATLLATYTKLEQTDRQFALNEGLGPYNEGVLDGALRTNASLNPMQQQSMQLAPINGSVLGENQVTGPLKNYILDNLANVFGTTRADIPEPISAISRFWVEYPFGGGWVYTKPGYRYEYQYSGFRRPCATCDVFVIGSDYVTGGMTGWGEGALMTAKSVVEEFF